MIKEFTCIVCPRGCNISVNMENSTIKSINNATCKRGEEYATQEITNPLRSIASSVIIENGDLPLASVRLTKPIPKSLIFKVMEEINNIRINAPVKIGQIIITNILDTNSDLIITRDVNKIV